MNSKGQETCYCYDAYGAVDAFNHCKVARGKLGWVQSTINTSLHSPTRLSKLQVS